MDWNNGKELVELDTSDLGDIVLLGADSNQKYAVMLYTNFEEENTLSPFYLSLFDVQKNIKIKTIEIENKNDMYSVELSNDGVFLYNISNNEKISYDSKLQNP